MSDKLVTIGLRMETCVSADVPAELAALVGQEYQSCPEIEEWLDANFAWPKDAGSDPGSDGIYFYQFKPETEEAIKKIDEIELAASGVARALKIIDEAQVHLMRIGEVPCKNDLWVGLERARSDLFDKLVATGYASKYSDHPGIACSGNCPASPGACDRCEHIKK